MNNRRLVRRLKIAAIGIAAVAVFGLVVMGLWNWLVPAVVHGPAITFWQALGLLILSKILLSGFHGRSHGPHWRRRAIERWERMTPEEREKFRQGWAARCGRPANPTPEPHPAGE